MRLRFRAITEFLLLGLFKAYGVTGVFGRIPFDLGSLI